MKNSAQNVGTGEYTIGENATRFCLAMNAIKPLAEQVDILCQDFPQLKNKKIFTDCEKHRKAEGCFVSPNWQLIAPTYGKAVRLALDALEQSHNGAFLSLLDLSKLDDRYLLQCRRTAEMFAQLVKSQGDVELYALSAQMGIQHRCESPRVVRERYEVGEFGLGLFDGAICLRTHPERLACHGDMGIELPGDVYSRDGDGRYVLTPFFSYENGELTVGAGECSAPDERWGSATVYLGS